MRIGTTIAQFLKREREIERERGRDRDTTVLKDGTRKAFFLAKINQTQNICLNSNGHNMSLKTYADTYMIKGQADAGF